MRNARKTDHILKLEEDCPSPLQELAEMLTPKAIKEQSNTSLALKGRTVSECLPELSIIARDEGIDLNTAKGWSEAVRIMDMNKLNR